MMRSPDVLRDSGARYFFPKHFRLRVAADFALQLNIGTGHGNSVFRRLDHVRTHYTHTRKSSRTQYTTLLWGANFRFQLTLRRQQDRFGLPDPGRIAGHARVGPVVFGVHVPNNQISGVVNVPSEIPQGGRRSKSFIEKPKNSVMFCFDT